MIEFAHGPGFVRCAFAGALVLMAADVEAILFDFTWHGDPARDRTIVSSTDPSLGARGTLDIDAAPGSRFTLADITHTDIAVSGDTIDDFMFSTWVEAGGQISADGTRASFDGPGNPYSAATVATFFGCRSPGCEFNFAIDVTRVPVSTPLAQVVYTSAEDALASLRLRAIPLPGPGGGPAIIIGGATLIATRHRRLHSKELK